MEIRSYRRVFDLERRVYSIDSLRLNPGGVPVRGIVYFAVIVVAGVLAARVPLLGGLVGALPWYLRDLALPGASATVLGVIRIEGRTFHLAALALLRFWAGPRRLAGLSRCAPIGRRWYPEELLAVADGSDARMRRVRYTGPGAVLVAVEHERLGRGTRRGSVALGRGRAAVVLTQRRGGRALGRNEVVLLGARARMLVRGGVGGESV